MTSIYLDVVDIDSVPDYGASTGARTETTPQNLGGAALSNTYTINIANWNAGYYREMVRYLQRTSFYRPIRFWLKNVGTVGARDVYVDIESPAIA